MNSARSCHSQSHVQQTFRSAMCLKTVHMSLSLNCIFMSFVHLFHSAVVNLLFNYLVNLLLNDLELLFI